MAVVGVSGARKLLYNAVMTFSGQKNSKAIDDIEEAKNWVMIEEWTSDEYKLITEKENSLLVWFPAFKIRIFA